MLLHLDFKGGEGCLKSIGDMFVDGAMRAIPRIALLVCLTSGSGFAATCAETSWINFRAPEYAFEASFPEHPSVRNSIDVRDGIQIKKTQYIAHENRAGTFHSYAVQILEWPSDKHVSENVLDDTSGSSARNIKPEYVHIIVLDGYSGRETLVLHKGLGLADKERSYLVGNRLYLVGAIASGDVDNDREVSNFFNSFHFSDR